ncbi:hypothetical protein D3C80_897870 [compost metagenome]
MYAILCPSVCNGMSEIHVCIPTFSWKHFELFSIQNKFHSRIGDDGNMQAELIVFIPEFMVAMRFDLRSCFQFQQTNRKNGKFEPPDYFSEIHAFFHQRSFSNGLIVFHRNKYVLGISVFCIQGNGIPVSNVATGIEMRNPLTFHH